MNVLIVDDSAIMRRIIMNTLLQIGIYSKNIYQAENGKEAIKIYEKQKIDLILTDWNMPVMNGFELVQYLREKRDIVTIFMITTEAGKKEVINALKAGVNNYIVKPFDSTILKNKINHYFILNQN